MTPQRFDSIELLVPLPDEPYAGGHPPADWHGLVPGDRGAVIEVYDAPPGYTVEFFREGKTVAVADVTPAQVRVVQRYGTPQTRTPQRVR
jgi:hypothetical protein